MTKEPTDSEGKLASSLTRKINPSTILAIVVQTFLLIWWLSANNTTTQLQITDLTRRVAAVEVSEADSLKRYGEIQGILGRVQALLESQNAMIRDLQSDRRIRPQER